MSAFNLIKRIRRDETGNVLVIGAATMPLLIGSAALAVDTIQLALWKRQLQRAADSGAIAGAYSYSQGGDSDAIVQSVENDLDENEEPTIVDRSITHGAMNGYDRAVRVSFTTRRTLPFIHFFTQEENEVRASAVAALLDDGKYCMISLYDGTEPGIEVTGDGVVMLGCGMAAGSRGPLGITAEGNSEVTASPLASVGGLSADDHFNDPVVLRPYSSPPKDPFAGVADPVVPAGMDCTQPLDVGPSEEVEITESR